MVLIKIQHRERFPVFSFYSERRCKLNCGADGERRKILITYQFYDAKIGIYKGYPNLRGFALCYKSCKAPDCFTQPAIN
jgi:hypothetical protein